VHRLFDSHVAGQVIALHESLPQVVSHAHALLH
jgi:hypothetical protein